MANEVYANSREIACKAGAGKTICAFPDVCFTPPENPATPPGVPVPYPNTGFASDTTEGSKTVMISNKEIMLKNNSYFNKSTGDEAGCAAKKGIITSKNTGKVYFTVWSMDVKIEGENVDRHLDLTTNNHASIPGDTPPWIYTDMMAAENTSVCEDQEKKAEDDCKDATPHMVTRKGGGEEQKGLDCSDDCKKAKACVLKPKSDDKNFCCDPETTGHHLVEVNCFTHESGRTPPGLPKNISNASVTYAEGVKRPERLSGFDNYDDEAAPCTCASETVGANSHGVMHAVQSKMRDAYAFVRQSEPLTAPFESYWTYGEARNAGARAHKIANPHCNEECTRRALDDYHMRQCNIGEDTPVRSALDYQPSTKGVSPQQAGKIRSAVNMILHGVA